MTLEFDSKLVNMALTKIISPQKYDKDLGYQRCLQTAIAEFSLASAGGQMRGPSCRTLMAGTGNQRNEQIVHATCNDVLR